MEKAEKSFKQKIVNAGIWNISGNIVSQFIRFGSNLVMTRLLLPEAFGLVAIAQTIIIGLALLSDLGLQQSLIRSHKMDDKLINTVWTIRFLQNLLIWIVSILISISIFYLNKQGYFRADSVYADARLPFIIVATGVCSVIAGFESTNIIIATRDLKFKIITVIAIANQLCALLVMLIIAYVYHTVWALVIGQITATIMQVYFSYKLFDGARNHFHIDKEHFRDLLHFGKWVFFCSVTAYLFSSSDKYVMGYLVDKNLLGQYGIAILIVSAVKGLITGPISSLGLPTLSTAVRENPANVKNVFYKLRLPIDAVSMFLMGFLYVSGATLINILYDQRYSSAGWMLQIFAIGFFELRYKLSGEFFMAIGKPKLTTQLILLDLVILYVGMYFLYQYKGIDGLVWVIACSSIGTIPLNLYYMNKYQIFDSRKEFITLPLVFVGLFAGYLFNYLCSYFK